jgi:hypothetical protein
VSPRSSATRAGQQGDRDHDPDQDQEIRHEILFQDWPCLAAGSRGDWIIQTVMTVIIPETRHWTETTIERTATTSTATMITTPMTNRDGASVDRCLSIIRERARDVERPQQVMTLATRCRS